MSIHNDNNIITKWNYSDEEKQNRLKMIELFQRNPIPDYELLSNLPLFIRRQDLCQIFFLNELYRQIIDIHGVIMEFGVRWGKNIAILSSLRGIYEPFNHNRKIIGFDTFSGFPNVNIKDGKSSIIRQGAYNVTKGYEHYLEEVINCHEKESPIAHIKKYELIKGDACIEIERYFKNHTETIVAFAYFDFDIYEPTKKCLELILPYMPKGSIIGFDELNCPDYPGESLAFNEVLGINKYKLTHSKYSPTQSYITL